MVFADRMRSLVYLVLSHVGDSDVKASDLVLELRPNLGELHAACELLLQDGKS